MNSRLVVLAGVLVGVGERAACDRGPLADAATFVNNDNRTIIFINPPERRFDYAHVVQRDFVSCSRPKPSVSTVIPTRLTQRPSCLLCAAITRRSVTNGSRSPTTPTYRGTEACAVRRRSNSRLCWRAFGSRWCYPRGQRRPRRSWAEGRRFDDGNLRNSGAVSQACVFPHNNGSDARCSANCHEYRATGRRPLRLRRSLRAKYRSAS